MKSKLTFLFPALLFVGLFSNDDSAQTAAAPAKNLTATKSYKVTISPRPGDSEMTASNGGSFKVGPSVKPTITVRWQKYGFVIQDDAGKDLGGISDEIAFGNKQYARFVIQKIVCVTQSNGAVTADTSTKTVLVRRGVAATF